MFEKQNFQYQTDVYQIHLLLVDMCLMVPLVFVYAYSAFAFGYVVDECVVLQKLMHMICSR